MKELRDQIRERQEREQRERYERERPEREERARQAREAGRARAREARERHRERREREERERREKEARERNGGVGMRDTGDAGIFQVADGFRGGTPGLGSPDARSMTPMETAQASPSEHHHRDDD